MSMTRLSLLAVLAATACTVGDDPGPDSHAGATIVDEPDDPETDTTIIEARVCASGTTTLGVDVSYYQGTINWAQAKAAGVKFAFLRVSDGTTFTDPKFATNWANTKSNGVIRGAYQFFRPNQSVTAQADMMIAAVGHYTPGDLPPVLDVEATGGLSASGVAAGVRTWVSRVKNALGVEPIIYSGMYFWRDQVGNPSMPQNPLWIAQYTTHCPDIPSTWSKWTFWQNTDSGHVNGIPGNVDMDKFNGDLAALQAFANGTPSSTTTPDPMPTSGACNSQTMNASEPEGTCVQSASDAKWYTCDGGEWVSRASSAGCATAYGYCQSATLGRAVAPRTCVQAASDNTWYQCDGHTWVTGVDYNAQKGPAGLCSEMHQL